MKTCVHCGTKNGDGVKFCEHCGKPIEIAITALNCLSCKKEIADPVGYCPHCGTMLSEYSVPPWLRGTWICRGADSGKYDITKILTANQMQTFFSDGRVWIGSAKKGEIPVFSDNWCITFSVTAAKGYDNMKVGEESVHTFSRNDERNGFTQGSNVFVKQDADIVIPTELRGTWLRRGADSETDFDLTRILTVNQMETNHSGGLAWTGIARHVAAARNPNPFMAGEYPSGWNITYSVTAVKDYNGIKEGEKNVRGFYLNAEKNAFTHGGLKDIWIKQEER